MNAEQFQQHQQVRTRTLRIASAQINPTVGDIDGNVRLMLDAARNARHDNADVVVFPELSLTG